MVGPQSPTRGLRGQLALAQTDRRNLWLGEDGRWPSQDLLYWTGQGESPNDLHAGCLQPDANGNDLWLAIEHGVGRNPPSGCRMATENPKRGQKAG